MTDRPLFRRLAATGAITEHEADRIREAAHGRTSGAAYLTFNVCNVLLDFDTSTATIEDELDAELEERVPLDEFLEAVQILCGPGAS